MCKMQTPAPLMGWPGLSDAFDHYQDIVGSYTNAQREAVAGLEESNTALSHYFQAYEAWLDATRQAFIPAAEAGESALQATKPTTRTQVSTPTHQRSRSVAREDRRTSEDAGTGQPTSAQSQRGRGQTASLETLRERVTNLEHRQQAMENTLEEIHAEVVQ